MKLLTTQRDRKPQQRTNQLEFRVTQVCLNIFALKKYDNIYFSYT